MEHDYPMQEMDISWSNHPIKELLQIFNHISG